MNMQKMTMQKNDNEKMTMQFIWPSHASFHYMRFCVHASRLPGISSAMASGTSHESAVPDGAKVAQMLFA